MRLDPPTFEAERKAAFASPDTMVRDTDHGVRYLEKTKEGERVVTDDAKHAHLFGLGGVFRLLEVGFLRLFDFGNELEPRLDRGVRGHVRERPHARGIGAA